MAWEHKMAEEFKKRNNKEGPVWMIGTILSTSPMTVSVLGGQVILEHPKTLNYIPPPPCPYFPPYEPGQRVAIVGNVFGDTPGSSVALFVGRCV